MAYYIVTTCYDGATWFYVGDKTSTGEIIPTAFRFSSFFGDAKIFKSKKVANDTALNNIGTRTDEVRKCPKCGKFYFGAPALSREDNKTEICPECGIREAMEPFLSIDEANKVLEKVNKMRGELNV